jgi:hypothetical protein
MKCHEVGWVGLEMKKEMKKKRVRRFAFVGFVQEGATVELVLAVRLLQMSVGGRQRK